MPQTIYDAMKRSVNPMAVELFESIATSDELFSLLEFVGKDGEGFEYDRENTLPTFEFVSPGHTSLVESTGTVDHVHVPKREAASEFHIRNFAQENLAGRSSPEQMQTRMKLKAAGRKIADKLINGGYVTGFTIEAFQAGPYVDAIVAGPWLDSERYGGGEIKYVNTGTFVSFRAPGDRDFGPQVAAAADGSYTLYSDNPNKWITVTLDVSDASADAIRRITFTTTTEEFDGLKKMMHPAQVLPSTGANGDEPSFNTLDKLIDQVKVRDRRAFLMPAILRRKYQSLLRATGGASPEFLLQNGASVPTYNGIPILTNDWIAANESKGSASTLSSVYLASLAAEEGVWMGALGGATFDVQADPRSVAVLGFRLYDLGQIPGTNKFGRRLAWYGAPAMGSYLACARASELITA